MRNKRAKALRRAVYGDQSQQVKRQYVMGKDSRHSETGLENAPGSLRQRYLEAKREYKHETRLQ